MSIPKLATSKEAKFDEDLTYSILANRARRKLLVALATSGPKTGADLIDRLSFATAEVVQKNKQMFAAGC